MGYRLWDPESQKVICSNDVCFNEAKFHAKPKKVEEIRRVVFSEDGIVTCQQVNVPNRVHVLERELAVVLERQQ